MLSQPPFLWPDGRSGNGRIFGATTSVGELEGRLASLFAPAAPVLFPSARAGLVAVLRTLGLDRNDRVAIPLFSSHCVIDAVGRVATPVPADGAGEPAAALVFHQWGFVHARSGGAQVIEDSADSLLGSAADLFPNRGRFELWSLPKVLGCASGGVVFCAGPSDADALRRQRPSSRLTGWSQWLLRQAKHNAWAQRYWLGAEAENGSLPGIACGDIAQGLERYPQIRQQRARRMEAVASVLPAWAKYSAGRLPCCVPVQVDPGRENKLRDHGLLFRHMDAKLEHSGHHLQQVAALPIHQDVDEEWLERALELLR